MCEKFSLKNLFIFMIYFILPTVLFIFSCEEKVNRPTWMANTTTSSNSVMVGSSSTTFNPNVQAGPKGYSMTFTSKEHWEVGTASGVSWNANPDELTMTTNKKVFKTPFIWIANSGENSVSKLNTLTGVEECKVSTVGTDPSRTAVDIEGNAWVGNRGSDNVVKINKDDCKVMLNVKTGRRPRGIALDAENNVWVSEYDDDTVAQFNGTTGAFIRRVQAPCAYGLAIDQKGYLWTSGRCKGVTSKIDTTNGEVLFTKTIKAPCVDLYGIAVDIEGHVWFGNYSCSNLVKVNGETGDTIGSYDAGCKLTRGVAVSIDNTVWTACSGNDIATAINGFTGDIRASINVCNGPIGIGIDATGSVWAPCQASDNVAFIDGVTKKVTNTFKVGKGPYTYSDMLGYAFLTVTKRNDNKATWITNFDTSNPNAQWGTIEWKADEPEGAKIEVAVKSAATKDALVQAGNKVKVTNGQQMALTGGQWIQVEVTFAAVQINNKNISPSLQDLTIYWK